MAKNDAQDSATSFGPAVGEKGAGAFGKIAGAVKERSQGTPTANQSDNTQVSGTGNAPLDTLTQYYQAQNNQQQNIQSQGLQNTQERTQQAIGGQATRTLKGSVDTQKPLDARKDDLRSAFEKAGFLGNTALRNDDAQVKSDVSYLANEKDRARVAGTVDRAQAGKGVFEGAQGANLKSAIEHPHTFHVNQAKGWEAGPTGYVGFDKLFGANAGTATRAADDLESRTRGDFDRAKGALASRQADYGRDLGNYEKAAGEDGHEWGAGEGAPTFDGSDLADDFAGAQDERAALGMGAGGVQALSPGMSRFGAGLTAAAGAPQFNRLSHDYQGLDTALAGAGTQANADAEAAHGRVDAAHAKSDADKAAADAASDPYRHDGSSGLAGTSGQYEEARATREAEDYAKQNGYADLDTMLREGYDSMAKAGQFSGSYEDYRDSYLHERWLENHQSAGPE